MNHSAQRRVGVIALATALVLLTGCTLAPPGESAHSTSVAGASPLGSTPSRSAPPALALSFGDAEGDVTADWSVDWTDYFFVDDRYTVLEPDDGNGSWSYRDQSTACEISFYQWTVGGLDAAGDDRATSDEVLAAIVMGTPTTEDKASISANAVDEEIEIARERGTIDVRVISGDYGDGWTFVHATRMFGARGGGVAVSVSCPQGQSAESEFSEIQDALLRVAVQS